MGPWINPLGERGAAVCQGMGVHTHTHTHTGKLRGIVGFCEEMLQDAKPLCEFVYNPAPWHSASLHSPCTHMRTCVCLC